MNRGAWRGLTLAMLATVVIAVVIADNNDDEPARPGGAPALPAQRVTIVQDDAELLHRGEARARRGAEALARLGVDWLRVTAGWSVIAPAASSAQRPDFDARNPDAYPPGAWASLDRAVDAAGDAGLDVMIDIAFWAPRWAVSRTVEPVERQRWGPDPEAYADFAEAVARRYDDAAAFAVWNEPNYDVFLLPQREQRDGRWAPASPHIYRAMLQAAAPRIRRRAPGSLILVGNTAASGSRAPDGPNDGVPPLDFVLEMACLDGKLQPLRIPRCDGFQPLPGDGYAHHPYSTRTPPEVADPAPGNARLSGLDKLAAILTRIHAAGRTERALPLFQTEYGYETNPPDPRQPWTPQEQARFLASAEMLAHRRVPNLRGWSQFLLRDLGPRPGPAAKRWSDFQSGLLFGDGRPKPALASFQLPVTLAPAPGGRVRIDGRVRPAPARGKLTVEAQVGRRWTALTGGEVEADRDGFFAATLQAPGARALRVRATGRSGAVLLSQTLALGD